jgi:hypothetical protein
MGTWCSTPCTHININRGIKKMNTELKTFTVNDREYKYRDLTPMEALSFGTKVVQLIAPFLMQGQNVGQAITSLGANEELPKILKEALGRCYNNKSESLENEAVFNKWFQEYPQDLFEAGVKATWGLVQPFLPSIVNTMNLEKI